MLRQTFGIPPSTYLKSGNYHRVFAAVVVRKLIDGGVNFALAHIIP
jgi:hypothetical protein